MSTELHNKQFTISLTLTRVGVKVLVIKPDGCSTFYVRRTEAEALESVRVIVMDSLQSHRDYDIY